MASPANAPYPRVGAGLLGVKLGLPQRRQMAAGSRPETPAGRRSRALFWPGGTTPVPVRWPRRTAPGGLPKIRTARRWSGAGAALQVTGAASHEAFGSLSSLGLRLAAGGLLSSRAKWRPPFSRRLQVSGPDRDRVQAAGRDSESPRLSGDYDYYCASLAAAAAASRTIRGIGLSLLVMFRSRNASAPPGNREMA